MLVINADDWGGWRSATDSTLPGLKKGTISAVSAMVFMEDSERAARIARELGLDVGLHLNLSQPFTARNACPDLHHHLDFVRRFLKRHRFSSTLYNRSLRDSFSYLYHRQAAEFYNLYDITPTRVDGHQHMHLCMNMIFDELIPVGYRVRRSFSFEAGERGFLNRLYRSWIDRRLGRRYKLTDKFYSLSSALQTQTITRVARYAQSCNVELMAHPEKPLEKQYLEGTQILADLTNVHIGTFRDLNAHRAW